MRIFELLEEIELDETRIPSSADLKKALLKKGYKSEEGKKHEKFYSPDGTHFIPMPRGTGQLTVGTARSIMKQAGITFDDL